MSQRTDAEIENFIFDEIQLENCSREHLIQMELEHRDYYAAELASGDHDVDENEQVVFENQIDQLFAEAEYSGKNH